MGDELYDKIRLADARNSKMSHKMIRFQKGSIYQTMNAVKIRDSECMLIIIGLIVYNFPFVTKNKKTKKKKRKIAF